uniref:Uncharacterized protein n=1 Tax=Lotus japonicus TaxID=34305 RepID=I3SMK5_LOTJA|nr:unknown [Lotus japonicus]
MGNGKLDFGKTLRPLCSQKLRRLTFKLPAVQSYFGANVLHPHTIIHVMQYGIPILIRNIFNLSASGTKIRHPSVNDSEDMMNLKSFVEGFATIDNLALINVEGR